MGSTAMVVPHTAQAVHAGPERALDLVDPTDRAFIADSGIGWIRATGIGWIRATGLGNSGGFRNTVRILGLDSRPRGTRGRSPRLAARGRVTYSWSPSLRVQGSRYGKRRQSSLHKGTPPRQTRSPLYSRSPDPCSDPASSGHRWNRRPPRSSLRRRWSCSD